MTSRSRTPSSCSAAGCASAAGRAPEGRSRSTAAHASPSSRALDRRALLGQHILGVEPGGARGEGERSGGWRGPGCAAARARGWARAHICPCKRQAQSLHLPRSAEKRYDNERTCVPHSPGCHAVFRPPPLVFSVSVPHEGAAPVLRVRRKLYLILPGPHFVFDFSICAANSVSTATG